MAVDYELPFIYANNFMLKNYQSWNCVPRYTIYQEVLSVFSSKLKYIVVIEYYSDAKGSLVRRPQHWLATFVYQIETRVICSADKAGDCTSEINTIYNFDMKELLQMNLQIR